MSFLRDKLYEYQQIANARMADELKEQHLKQLEAEHAEAEKMEREKNSIIEFERMDVPATIKRSMSKESLKTEFDKRLEVLMAWMKDMGFKAGDKLPKKYTIEKVYCELAGMDGDLFNSIGLSSFERHFWRKQKICELTRGNKSTIL
ncbi:hypothetical protein [Methylomonas sp. HYX-M1]|uniref:hypothetical protein n=1 Tax=Methylomonas sp. HYX-M1 TaxID=3139307 RepID=UPI00345B86CA